MTDLLWEIDLTSGSALLTDDLSELSGVMIDVENLSSDTESERLIFTDKNTDRLWLYDTTAIK